MDVGLVICNLFNDSLTQGRQTKSMVMGLKGLKQTDCAGEDHQQISRPGKARRSQ